VIDGPVFPGGSTLCESVTGFDPYYTISDCQSASELDLTLWPENLSDFKLSEKQKRLHMFIKKLLNSSLESTEYDDLNAIAQDFADSSFANITARTLFNLCSDASYPDYTFECESLPSVAPKTNAKGITSPEDQITIERSDSELFISSAKLFTGYLKLYDLSGRVIKSEKLKDVSSHTLTGDNLVPGIYYWSLTSIPNSTILSSGLWPIYQ
jgi:hypothetical protein